MLPQHIMDLAPEAGEDLQTVVDFLLFAELGQVSAEDEKIGARAQQIRLLNRTDEPAVPVANKALSFDPLDVGIGDVAEAEPLISYLGTQGNPHEAHGQGRQDGGPGPDLEELATIHAHEDPPFLFAGPTWMPRPDWSGPS